ncbi:MAG: prephenate dehydrogenase/arogenate dehydrogenase family protein [Nitrospinota bacterium]|nr:prephenate dehydrogenase/arogenate dehydrogenase family protein [Nitrospinota bacterium]
MFGKAAIIGVGLIGGSLARVFKNRGIAEKVTGSGRSRENMEKAVTLGIIDESLPAEEAVKDADLVFLCGPVKSILPTLEKIAPNIKKGAIVSDAGSTKKSIVDGAKIIAGGKFTFIGSHPIAGTEKSGADASFETLFDNHKCILTPDSDTPEKELELLKNVWKKAGMEIVIMTPERHDKILGAVSHLPHFVVYALVNTVSDLDKESDLIKFAAGGFKDFTRIASSPPEMWADIALENASVMGEQMEMMIEHLQIIREAIRENDKEILLEIFGKSSSFRKKLP